MIGTSQKSVSHLFLWNDLYFFISVPFFLAKCKADVDADAASNDFFFQISNIYSISRYIHKYVQDVQFEAIILEAFPIIAKNVGNKS